MKKYEGEQPISQLEKRKGGYFYLQIEADIVNQFTNKGRTRLICKLNNELSFQCGLNHLGDGNFFIIVSTKNMKKLDRQASDLLQFELTEDPNPLGVEMPEVFESLLEQDEELKRKFDQFSDGKKRSILHLTSRIKDIDKQIARITEAINNPDVSRPKRTF